MLASTVMFISIIHLFHILSWLLDECGWENGLYNFNRTTVEWGMIGRASQWNMLKRKESSGWRHITLLTIICIRGMWTTRKGVDDLLMLWHLTINNDYGRQWITKLGYHREIWRVDLTVLKRIYISKCLRPNLFPFLARKTNHIFWPDLASAHYSTKTLEFLNTSNANLVPKAINPPNVPQCRPIEDFFWALATKVYAGNWVSKDTPILVARNRRCVREFPLQVVHDTDKVTKHIHACNLQFMPLIYS